MTCTKTTPAPVSRSLALWVILPVWLSACSRAEPADHEPREAGRYRVEQVLILRPAEGTPAELIEPMDLVWGPGDRLLVADLKPSSVKVYGADGSLERIIGAEGDGPGEFRGPLIAARDTLLVVLDVLSGRLQSFGLASGDVRQHATAPAFLPIPPMVDGRGRVLIGPRTSGGRASFYRVDLPSRAVDSMTIPDERLVPEVERWTIVARRRDGSTIPMRLSVPLQPRLVTAVGPDGRIISGWTDQYDLQVWDEDLQPLFSLRRDLPAISVTAARKARLVDGVIARSSVFGDEAYLRPQLPVDRIPDVEPFLTGVHVDGEGRFWVVRAEPGDDVGPVPVDLWSATGELLDTLHIPRELWPDSPHRLVFSGDRFATLKMDEEGFMRIVVGRLMRGTRH